MDEIEKSRLESGINPELRLGYVTDMYYAVTGKPSPKQLDLINDWFGDLIVRVRKSDRTKKESPEFIDKEHVIYATQYHNYLYNSGNPRVTNIVGKLVGTASSNQEKERKASELIQKNVSRRIVSEMNPILVLRDRIDKELDLLSEEQTDAFHYELYMFSLMTAESYYARDQYDRDTELFSFDDEVFDQIIYNAFYQLQLYEYEGMVNAFLWLLLGSLLRNECGRICRMFDSSFSPLYRQMSETGTLIDKLRYLIAPEDYEDYYTGNDLEKRFPGIEWYCDGCGDHLNVQIGFDDHLNVWQCRKCGYLNDINSDQIFDNEEDVRNGIHRSSKECLDEVIKRIKSESEDD